MPIKIPSYRIEQFKKNNLKPYQVERFNAQRHFEVTYPHRHDGFFEILFLTKGSGIHLIDFQSYTIKENTIFFLAPGQIHSLNLSDDIQGYIFIFTSEFYLLNKQNKNKLLELPFFYALENAIPPLYLKNQKNIELLTNLFLRGIEEMNDELLDNEEMINALLDMILIHCHRLYPTTHEIEGMQKGKLLVKRFKQLIDTHYHENLSVNAFSELLNVTPNHLTETVKNLTGTTSNELIKAKLMIEAKRLLLFTDDTITEISNQLNFKDQSYFTRVFKRHCKISPKEFRLQKFT